MMFNTVYDGGYFFFIENDQDNKKLFLYRDNYCMKDKSESEENLEKELAKQNDRIGDEKSYCHIGRRKKLELVAVVDYLEFYYGVYANEGMVVPNYENGVLKQELGYLAKVAEKQYMFFQMGIILITLAEDEDFVNFVLTYDSCIMITTRGFYHFALECFGEGETSQEDYEDCDCGGEGSSIKNYVTLMCYNNDANLPSYQVSFVRYLEGVPIKFYPENIKVAKGKKVYTFYDNKLGKAPSLDPKSGEVITSEEYRKKRKSK